jgi:23S rRNA (cytidine1920-2'-O)/16S rRNA (cytidine1409-2'-O)-methyltransferase
MAKKRLDILMLEKGLVSSRERAQGLILAGKVLVNDEPQTKPGHAVLEASQIRIRGDQEHPYVSRGGTKLEAALDAFGVIVKDKVALDIGASTGGFTHVLLLRGAQRVHAVDVGHSQMDWQIRSNPRVIVKEKLNARYLEFAQIGETVDCIVMDVSFISVEKILPSLLQFSHSDTHWIVLIKPQFEVGKGKLGKGGIVSSEQDRQEVVDKISLFAKTLGLTQLGLIESPITGTEGNKEFLIHWKLK